MKTIAFTAALVESDRIMEVCNRLHGDPKALVIMTVEDMRIIRRVAASIISLWKSVSGEGCTQSDRWSLREIERQISLAYDQLEPIATRVTKEYKRSLL